MERYNLRLLRKLYYSINAIVYTLVVFIGIYKDPLLEKYGTAFNLILTFLVFLPFAILFLFIIKRIIVLAYVAAFRIQGDKTIKYKTLEKYYYPIIFITSLPIPLLFISLRYTNICGINLFSALSATWSIIQIAYFCYLSFFIVKNIFNKTKRKSLLMGSLPTIILGIIWLAVFLLVNN